MVKQWVNKFRTGSWKQKAQAKHNTDVKKYNKNKWSHKTQITSALCITRHLDQDKSELMRYKLKERRRKDIKIISIIDILNPDSKASENLWPMTELDLEERDLSSSNIKKFSSLSIFNWRALESQFRSLSYFFSVKIMILRDVVNTSSLLKTTWKIDTDRLKMPLDVSWLVLTHF